MSQNLYYICIAREKIILADYSEMIGNYRVIMEDILNKVKPNTLGIYTLGDYKFFIKSDNDNFIACILCSIYYSQQVGLKALESVYLILNKKTDYEQRTQSLSHSLDKLLKNDIKEKYEYFNTNENEEKISLNNSLQEFVEIEQKTLNELIEKDIGVQLKISYPRNASALKYKEFGDFDDYKWWKNKELMVAIIIITVLLSWMISSAACGFDYQNCYN